MNSQSGLGEALRLSRAGHLDQAVIALEAVLADQPDNALALASLADVQLRRRRYQEAAECLDRAEALSGTTANTARLRGDLFYRQRRYAQAARSYEEADALGDRGTWALEHLARSYMRLKDLEAAKGAAAKAAERAPAESRGWLVLGEIALGEGRFAEAETLLQRAHDAAPRDAFVYAKLLEARVMQLPGDRRAAEVEIISRTSAKGNRFVQQLLARLQQGEGRLEEAAATHARAAEASGDAFARAAYAFSLKKAGRLDEAARAFAQCLAEDPADPVIYKNYVAVQKTRGALAELRSTLEELLPRAGERRYAFLSQLKKLDA